jgi:hypothetical protein
LKETVAEQEVLERPGRKSQNPQWVSNLMKEGKRLICSLIIIQQMFNIGT